MRDRRSRIARRGRRRHGYALLDISVSSVLLAALVVLGLQGIDAQQRQQKAATARQAAVIEAGNLLDEIAALDWSELTAERVGKFTLSDELRRQLPGAALHVALEPVENPAGRRITLEIDPAAGGGLSQRPVRLLAWVYAPPTAGGTP